MVVVVADTLLLAHVRRLVAIVHFRKHAQSPRFRETCFDIPDTLRDLSDRTIENDTNDADDR